MVAARQGKAHHIHWLPSKGECAAFCLLPAGSAAACCDPTHVATAQRSTLRQQKRVPHLPRRSPHISMPPFRPHLCCSEEAGVESKGRLALEVASVFPVMMGAAFTQNNINSAVSGRCVEHSLLPLGGIGKIPLL